MAGRNEGKDRATGLLRQIGAYLALQWAVQKRAYWSGIGRTLLPLILLAILVAIQWLVDVQLQNSTYRCGCECTSCCEWLQPESDSPAVHTCYTATANRTCPLTAECQSRNESNCGPQYSTYTQVAFCEVSSPPTWPAMLQVPLARYRPLVGGGPPVLPPDSASGLSLTDTGPSVVVPYTGNNQALAARLTANMLANQTGIGARLIQVASASPQLHAASLGRGVLSATDLCANLNASATSGKDGSSLSALSQLSALLQPDQNRTAGGGSALQQAAQQAGFGTGNELDSIAFLTYQLSQFFVNISVVLGTPADTTPSQLIEPGFLAGSSELGHSAQQAANTGSGGGSFGAPPSASTDDLMTSGGKQPLPMYFMAQDCDTLLKAGGTDLLVLQQLSCGLQSALGMPLVCTSLALEWHPAPASINNQLYCGWSGSGCIPSPVPNTPLPAPGASPPLPNPTSGTLGGRRLQQRALKAEQGTVLPAAQDPGAPSVSTAVPPQYPGMIVDWGATEVYTPASSTAVLDIVVWVNNTNVQASISPYLQRWPAPINGAVNSFLRAAVTPPQLRLEGMRGFPAAGGPLRLDLASLLGPLFQMWVMMLPLPVMVAALAGERVGGQRGLLLRQGLQPISLGIATYLWWLLMYAAYVAVFWGFGAGMGLGFFTRTAFGPQIVLYIVWFHAMHGMAMWFSVFYEDVINGVLASVAVLIFSGLVANLVVVQFVQSGPEWLALLLEALMPPFALFRALWEAAQFAFLADSVGGKGLTWQRVREPGNGFAVALAFMSAHWVVGCYCAWYWEQVFGMGELSGPRRHPFFPMGFRLAPDEPRGWDWFTNRALVTRNILLQLPTLRARSHQAAHPVAPASLSPSAGRDKHSLTKGGQSSQADGGQPGEDVAAERERVEQLWAVLTTESLNAPGEEDTLETGVYPRISKLNRAADSCPPAVIVHGVRKVFQSTAAAVRGPPVPVTAPVEQMEDLPHIQADDEVKRPTGKVAVAGLWLAVAQGECFGLLGPNGAGKTTTLRIMQGLMEPSAGEVRVCGRSVAQEPRAVAACTGICPQHDALWPSLSAHEHLLCYGRLRGLRGDALREAISEQLRMLGLTDSGSNRGRQAELKQQEQDNAGEQQGHGQKAIHDKTFKGCIGMLTSSCRGLWGGEGAGGLAHRPCSSFSGGMRRRLSVACALLGSPAVAFLDEPSAGLDPASRTALWQAVRAARSTGTAIVLTTHSMDEAEALCDRLGVFVDGQLKCVGSAQELCRRFAQNLLLSLTTSQEEAEAAQKEVAARISSRCRLVSSASGAQRWEVPKDCLPLAQIFARVKHMAAPAGPLRLLDWSVTSASLDHVFAEVLKNSGQ